MPRRRREIAKGETYVRTYLEEDDPATVALGEQIRRQQPQPSDREFAHWMEQRRLMFIATSNPLWAWEAFRLSRAYGRPAPEWFLRYLNDAAGDIRECQTHGYHRRDFGIDAYYDFILRSLRFKGDDDKGGPGNDGLASMERERFAHDVAERIRVHCHFGHKLTVAIECAALFYKMPTGTARAYWYQYKAVVESGDLELQIARVKEAGFVP